MSANDGSSCSNGGTQLERNFTHRFLRSLRRLRSTPGRAAHRLTRRRGGLRIKLAANSAMARAVGSRRAWSRALLLSSRLRRSGPPRRRKTTRAAAAVSLKKKVSVGKLRELVPGGRRMEMCELLEETAHYVQCLAVQVKVMQAVADLCSGTA